MNILFGNWYAVFVVDSLANLRLLDGLLVVYRSPLSDAFIVLLLLAYRRANRK